MIHVKLLASLGQTGFPLCSWLVQHCWTTCQFSLCQRETELSEKNQTMIACRNTELIRYERKKDVGNWIRSKTKRHQKEIRQTDRLSGWIGGSVLWLCFHVLLVPRGGKKKTSVLLSFISNMFRNNRGLSVHEACFHSLLILDKSCTSEKRQNFRKEEETNAGSHLSSCVSHVIQ